MLQLDSDLFQTAALGLSLVSLLILLLVLNNLSKIRKQLEEGLTRSQIGDITSPAATQEAYAAAPLEAASPVTQTQPVAQAEPAWSPEAAGTATPATSWGESAWSGPADTAAAPVQQAPAAVAAQPAQTGPNIADMPDEQPVEHEGRWWFKRGSELLIYDESTGQWGPAPQAAAAAPAPAAQPIGGSAFSEFQELSTSQPAAETATGGSFGAEGSGFWKCASCGAVNGSTSTSCRMCFAARS